MHRGDGVPLEVHLPRAPLIRVICQVRFPLIASIEDPKFIGEFQEVLRPEYPILREERALSLTLNASGMPVTSAPAILWRFKDGSGNWRVTLSTDFLAIETTAYESRDGFLARAGFLLAVLREKLGVGLLDRIGIRYIDRVVDPELKDIHHLVNKEFLGVLATPLASKVERSISECLIRAEPSGPVIQARWGLMPPKATFDPSAIEPIPDSSWVLDIDMYRTGPVVFDHQGIVAELRGYCEEIYGYFRWVVTEQFLATFGGEVLRQP